MSCPRQESRSLPRLHRPAAGSTLRWLWTLSLAAGIATGVAACSGSESAASEAAVSRPEVRAVPVRVLRPEVQATRDVLRLPADLEPQRRAALAAEVTGTVDSVHAEEGQRVSRGAILARVDTRSLEQAVAEAKALAVQAQARFERAQALLAKRSITQSQMLDAITERDVTQVRLESAELRLSKSRLRAPWSGRVAHRRVEVGDYVNAGQPMFEILDDRTLKAVAPVPAADVRFLEEGAPVTLRLPALGGEAVEGTIIRLAAELDADARTLELEAQVANPEGRLRPGMFAHLEVVRRELEEALLVPLSAVVDLGSERVVYIVEEQSEGARARRRPVELGPTVGAEVVVTAGLEPGEAVVIEGQEQIAEGSAVDVRGDER